MNWCAYRGLPDSDGSATGLLFLLRSTAGYWCRAADRFWGIAWVGDTHAISSELLLWLIALHLVGVVFTSWRHRENLMAAMIFDRKRGLGAG